MRGTWLTASPTSREDGPGPCYFAPSGQSADLQSFLLRLKILGQVHGMAERWETFKDGWYFREARNRESRPAGPTATQQCSYFTIATRAVNAGPLFCVCVCVCVCVFLGPYPQHMDVPRLGV